MSADPRVLWDRQGNPTKHVSDALNIVRWQPREALHKIEARSNLGPADRVILFSDGKATDDHGDEIGDILDEP